MKKIIFLVGLLVLLIVLAIGTFFWAKTSFAPVSSEENYQDFLIAKGSGASVVASKLEKEGFIKSAFAFKIYTQATGISKRIQAGEYRLSPHMNLAQIVTVLTSPPMELWVTIPEGLRREEVVQKFIDGLSKTGDERDIFRSEFLEASKALEGFLFPDTYLFPKEVKASVVVNKMKAVFDLKIKDFEGEIANSKLSIEEIANLAAILERETVTNQERPIVAGILLNRLELGMPLQADATVQYALANVNCKGIENCTWWPRPLTRDDLDIDSRYNTYKYASLPAGPIASAGISSLKAVINPESSNYLYYIHEPNGTIHYAETLDQHNANVRKYLGK